MTWASRASTWPRVAWKRPVLHDVILTIPRCTVLFVSADVARPGVPWLGWLLREATSDRGSWQQSSQLPGRDGDHGSVPGRFEPARTGGGGLECSAGSDHAQPKQGKCPRRAVHQKRRTHPKTEPSGFRDLLPP